MIDLPMVGFELGISGDGSDSCANISEKIMKKFHSKSYRAAQHSKREPITKIIGVSSGTTYVYIVVTK